MLNRTALAAVLATVAALAVPAVCESNSAGGGWRSCGLAHRHLTIPQDGTVSDTQRIRAYRHQSCASARWAFAVYFTRGPKPCLGSGCYGKAGGLWCGSGKVRHEVLQCAASEHSSRVTVRVAALHERPYPD